VRPAGAPREPHYPLGDRTISDYLRERARRAPNRAALSFYGASLSFADLDEQSDRLATWLDRAGVEPGDRVGVLLPNCPQFAIAFHAILKLGAVYVPLNPMFREHELGHELADAQVRVLVALDELALLVDAVRPRAGIERVLYTAAAEYLPDEPALPVPGGLRAPPAEESRRQWREALAGERLALRAVDLDALAALNYTGGTTGMPKGCEHSQRHMLYTSVTAAAVWRFGADFGGSESDAGVVFFPAFWIAGEDLALLIPVVTGTTCVLLNRWDPAAVLAAIERHRATLMVGTVDSYVELLECAERERRDASTLRVPLAASFVRKLDVEIRRAWQAYAGPASVLRECSYGMTETHTMDTSTAGFEDDDRDLRSRPVFCGLPMPGTDVKVVDFESRALLPLGDEGEIAIRSPSVLTGYWRAPAETAAALRDGWLYTGDMGMLDEDGCLHYLGRRKELIKVKGMSVFPAELETLIGMHPAVQGVAVVPREDADRGQVPRAFVELLDGSVCDEDELVRWARENVASYKVPEIAVVAALPRTATGKIVKGDLVARA